TIGDRTGIGRRDRAVWAEGRLQQVDLIRHRLARLLIPPHLGLALAGADGDGYGFAVEGAILDRRAGTGQRSDSVLVLSLTGELVLLGAVLGKGTHQSTLVIGVLQSVQEHVVKHLAM